MDFKGCYSFSNWVLSGIGRSNGLVDMAIGFANQTLWQFIVNLVLRCFFLFFFVLG